MHNLKQGEYNNRWSVLSKFCAGFSFPRRAWEVPIFAAAAALFLHFVYYQKFLFKSSVVACLPAMQNDQGSIPVDTIFLLEKKIHTLPSIVNHWNFCHSPQQSTKNQGKKCRSKFLKSYSYNHEPLKILAISKPVLKSLKTFLSKW